MISFVRRIWKAAPIATVLLAVALVAGLFFSVRMTAHWIYWGDDAHRNQPIAGWMTPGYIAHSWHVPREVVIDAIDAPRCPDGPRNLDHLARDQGRPVADLVSEAEAAIAAYRAEMLVPSDPSATPGTRP